MMRWFHNDEGGIVGMGGIMMCGGRGGMMEE